MALNPVLLATQLSSIESEGKTQEAIALEFANIITNYIKTANVVTTGVGNMGAPVQSIGSLQ